MPWRSDYTVKHTHNLKFFGAHKSKISRKLKPQKNTQLPPLQTLCTDSGFRSGYGFGAGQRVRAKLFSEKLELDTGVVCLRTELRTEKMCKVELNKGAARGQQQFERTKERDRTIERARGSRSEENKEAAGQAKLIKVIIILAISFVPPTFCIFD